jgi:hypothetical protein
LTIAPGMVVKFDYYRGLYVDDTLRILGTEELPVIFTSLADDTVGGDTNGDGSQSYPEVGMWYGIIFNERSNDANSVIEHLTIRYSGYNENGAIVLQNASPTLRAISFEDNYINGVQIATEKLETDTWDNTDVVYVITSNSVTVPADQVLTIAPGMVVKFDYYRGLYVDDTLRILGTEELPVIFTSLADDTVGGDTNGDGSQSYPEVGMWYGIIFNERSNDANSVIEHLTIRYSGYNENGAIVLQNASPTLLDIVFEDNWLDDVEIKR